ncbi:STAS domain-containing protein [Filimonas effusa]|uniref:Anti-anti-sigma factor n=1 Tax=Filimonas effusa TaxID=2508721 RepID=A0A4Q1D9B4_9BACT|nr:STAS domain-containing protein [Filimonas effusa]RXK85285.1 anti-anti-sigma factor [Filimonas effusa]
MQVKIDTKEKFTVVTPEEPVLSDNLAASFSQLLLPYLQKDIKNIVLNLKHTEKMELNVATELVNLQQKFYENSTSFVICEIPAAVEAALEELALLELLNTTPTESEAWDIVQMEEIERELLDDDEPLFR